MPYSVYWDLCYNTRMRNILIKIAYAIGLFVVTVLVSEALTSNHSTATTEALARATLPIVHILRGEEPYNEIHGYLEARDVGAYRADITPIDTDRQIDIEIDPYGQQVTRMSYEVRDITGARLIDSQDVTGFYVLNGGVTRVSFTIGNLLSTDTEYLLILRISTTDVQDAYFYTRIIYADASTIEEGELEYARVLDFIDELHGKTFEKNNRSDLSTYIYLEDTSGTANYGYVTNGSSYEEVTWGDLSPVVVSEPIWTITDIQENVYGVSGTYVIEVTQDEVTTWYDVSEFYRVYEGSDRFHVLDYERITDQIYDAGGVSYGNDEINLGIMGSGVTAMKSDSREYAAFVADGRLFLCAVRENSVAYVFGFSEAGSLDRRNLYRDSQIKILAVDDDGNVDFLVYGYMNRGSHEGTVGAAEYYYSADHHTIEEKAFVPYTGSAQMLAAQIENASYLAEDKNLYLLLEGDLIRIQTQSSEAEILRTSMEENDVAVSDSGRLISWREDAGIVLTDLEDLTQQTIPVSSGEFGTPLGFIGEDLIYGLSRDADAAEDLAGAQFRPMYTIRIVDSELNVLEAYSAAGYYISDCILEEGQITLQRVQQATDENGQIYYLRADNDQILSGNTQNSGENGVKSSSSSTYGRITTVAVSGFDGDDVRYYRPNEILYEGDRNITLAAATASDNADHIRYEVYNYRGLTMLTYNAREAINAADDVSGVVVDNEGRYLWQSQIRSVAEIEDISRIEGVAVSEDTIAACLAVITEYEGSPQTQDRISNGESPMSIARADAAIEQYVDGVTAVDLSGIALDKVLYYVSIYKPVMAMTTGSDAVLIVGYSNDNIVLYDPQAGGRSVMTRSNAQTLFQQGGSRYTVYY